jgi:trimeric autotransporter adhesin
VFVLVFIIAHRHHTALSDSAAASTAVLQEQRQQQPANSSSSSSSYSSRPRQCDVIWQVTLCSGRRVLTLRSAAELINSTALPLEVRCTSSSSSSSRAGEVVGVIAPLGGRLPLPLRWSHAQDIRIRPVLPPTKSDSPDATVVQPLLFDYSDCSLLMPTARSGSSSDDAGSGSTSSSSISSTVMAATAWVACPPAVTPALAQAAAAVAVRPRSYIFYLHALQGGIDSDFTNTNIANTNSSSSAAPRPPPRRRHSTATATAAATASAATSSAVARFQPLAVEVCAALVLRNALPVAVRYRVAGGGALQVLDSGVLAAGACVHVYELSATAQSTVVSFQVSSAITTIAVVRSTALVFT